MARPARCSCPRAPHRQHVAHGSCGAKRSLRCSARQSGARCSPRCTRTRCFSCRLPQPHPLGIRMLAVERKCSPRCPTWAQRVWHSKRLPRLRSRRTRRPSSRLRARSCGVFGFSRQLSTRATLTSCCAHSSYRTVRSLPLTFTSQSPSYFFISFVHYLLCDVPCRCTSVFASLRHCYSTYQMAQSIALLLCPVGTFFHRRTRPAIFVHQQVCISSFDRFVLASQLFPSSCQALFIFYF